MAQISSIHISLVPLVNVSKFRIYKNINVQQVVTMKARIRDDLKAGGSLPTKFSVSLTRHLAMTTDLKYRYDSKPPEETKNYDISIANGLKFSF